MTAVNELLDNVKIRLNLASDMALAERLTVTRSLVSRWRKGDTPLADERIAQICALAKLDGPHWTAQIHAERAQSPAERAMWKSMLDRLSAVAAVLALVVFAAPGAARAKAIDSQGFSGSNQPHSVYYVTKGSTQANPKQSSPGHMLPPPPSSNPPNAPQNQAPRRQPSHPACRPAGVGSTHHLRTGLAMRLADFIERNAREILEDAVAFAETQAPDTVEFSVKQLRNHLPQILQAVVDDLRSPQTASQQVAKSHGLAPLKPGPESAASYHG